MNKENSLAVLELSTADSCFIPFQTARRDFGALQHETLSTAVHVVTS